MRACTIRGLLVGLVLPMAGSVGTGAVGSVQIYLTPDEARTRIFPEAVRFESQIHHVPSSYAQASADTLGSSLDLADSLVVSVARGKGGELLGYAAVTDEVGKFRPITFMVGFGADLRVRQVAVLVYR